MMDVFDLQAQINQGINELRALEKDWKIHKDILDSLRPKRKELLRQLSNLNQQQETLYVAMSEDDLEEGATSTEEQLPKQLPTQRGKKRRPKGSVQRVVLEFVRSCGESGALTAPIIAHAQVQSGALAKIVIGGYLTQEGKRKPYYLTKKGEEYLNTV